MSTARTPRKTADGGQPRHSISSRYPVIIPQKTDRKKSISNPVMSKCLMQATMFSAESNRD